MRQKREVNYVSCVIRDVHWVKMSDASETWRPLRQNVTFKTQREETKVKRHPSPNVTLTWRQLHQLRLIRDVDCIKNVMLTSFILKRQIRQK